MLMMKNFNKLIVPFVAISIVLIIAGFYIKSRPKDPSCPLRTNNWEIVAKCPQISSDLKKLLKNLNKDEDKSGCTYSSSTTNFAIGTRFVSWSLIKSHFCENSAHPEGDQTEQTYDMKVDHLINFSTEFNIEQLEKYFLANANLKTAADNNKESCADLLDEGVRKEKLGSFNSVLKKSQMRINQNEKDLRLEILAHVSGHSQYGCILSHELEVDQWGQFLLSNSQLAK
jgi:hypothetical protein